MDHPSRAVSSAWNHYWFRPGSLQDLACMRLVLVAAQLLEYGSGHMAERIASAAQKGAGTLEPILLLQLLAWPFGGAEALVETKVAAIACLTGLAGIGALLGIVTRFSLGAFAAGNLLVLSWVYSAARFQHTDALLVLGLCTLALAPAGKRLSLDAKLRPEPEAVSEYARWPILLVRWLLALAYLSSAGAKLAHAGLDWANGYTLQYVAFAKGSAHHRMLGIWISEHHYIAQALSVFVLLFQSSFWTLLIWPRLARIYLPMGLALHAGIFLAMGLPFFQFMALYVVLLPALRMERRGP